MLLLMPCGHRKNSFFYDERPVSIIWPDDLISHSQPSALTGMEQAVLDHSTAAISLKQTWIRHDGWDYAVFH
jgi:hypothetical protein